MALPASLRTLLNEFGQAAVEVPTPIEGYREFVSVYCGRTEDWAVFEMQFPYYAGVEVAYRLVRFRANASLIEQDYNFSMPELAGLQEIYLPSEEAVEFVLALWKVAPESFVAPKLTDIPV